MHSVIPAQAGSVSQPLWLRIQLFFAMALQQELDPGYRPDDGMKEC